jgi:hypothetical protein
MGSWVSLVKAMIGRAGWAGALATVVRMADMRVMSLRMR